MIWFEVADDCGDGTTTRRRFHTREEAQAWRDKMEDDEYFMQDGDGSPVEEIDSDDPDFYHADD